MPWPSMPLVPGRRSRRTILLFMMAFGLTAVAQKPADADGALSRTRERLLAELEQMPRYTCVQTINRQYFRPRFEGAACSMLIAKHEQDADKLDLRSWDRLRLELAIVDGDYVYSWGGAPRFESGTLEQLAGRGPLSYGDFGAFLNSIFSLATITFKSEERAGQRRLLTYTYDMPADRSKYDVKNYGGRVITAYSGTFVIDPDASDIVSLTVRTAELPEGNPACQAISEVEYGRTQIHDRLVLIPQQTRLIAINRKNGEIHSLTTYSSCREYTSKSRLLFGDTANGAASSTLPAKQSPAITLPAGLHFRARIVSSIDSNTAAAGDPIEAVLLAPIRGDHHRTWAPAGTRLHGRLLRLEQTMSPSYFEVMVQFESIELNGSAVPLRAAPDLSRLSGMSTAGGSYQPAVSVIPNVASRENVFVFSTSHLRLKKFDWAWTTLPEQRTPLTTFPGGLHLSARIVTPIDSDTSLPGDPIEAVLRGPILSKDGQEWAPAGAPLQGQLLGLKKYELKTIEPPSNEPKLEGYVEVLVRFESIELDGSAVLLGAAPDLSDPFGFEAADSPYGEDMSVIPDETNGGNLFLFHMQHLHMENFSWGWTTLPTRQSPPSTIPAGLHFHARLVTSIDSNTAAPADPIEAILLSPIRDKDGREWAPVGARLHGRLLGLRHRQLKSEPVVEILMQFESIELNGRDVSLQAAPDLSDLDEVASVKGGFKPFVRVIPDEALRMNFFIFSIRHVHPEELNLEKFEWGWTTAVPGQQKEKKDETGAH